MKNHIILIVLYICPLFIHGQSIEFSGLYSSTQAQEFVNTSGVEAGLSYDFLSRSRISLECCFTSKKTSYSLNYPEIVSGSSIPDYYYFNMINSDCSKSSLKLFYGWKLINGSSSSLFIGPVISINYFSLNRNYNETFYNPTNSSVSRREYSKSETFRKRFGKGLFVEFSCNSSIIKKLDLFSRFSFERINYDDEIYLGTVNDPETISSYTVNIGVRYHFVEK